MKHIVKKSITVALIFVFLILSLIGCGTSTPQKKGDDGTDTETLKISTDNTEKPMKLKLLGPTNANRYIKFEEREEYPVWQELEKLIEKYNLELEYEIVPREQYGVVIQTRMASASNLPDIANLYGIDDITALNFAQQKIIVELNSLINKYSNGNIKSMQEKNFPFATKLTTAPDGNRYWFTNLHTTTHKLDDNSRAPTNYGLTMIIRKDWLVTLGIGIPANAEEYLNALKAMRVQDVNNNGVTDEILIYNISSFDGAIAQWLGLGTGMTAIDLESNKVVSPWYQPGIKEYFMYLNKLVKEGLIDTSLVSATPEREAQALSENRVASLHDYGTQSYREAMVQGAKAEYLPLMPLSAVEGITPKAQLEPPNLVWQKYVITKACKDIKAAITFFDMVHSEEYGSLLLNGIEGLTFAVVDGDRYSLENTSWEERAKTRRIAGNVLYGDTVFPRIQVAHGTKLRETAEEKAAVEEKLNKIRSEKSLVFNAENESPEYKLSYIENITKYKPFFYNFNSNFFAISSKEQVDERRKLGANLDTYANELAINLALGRASLDDWDKNMKELKELGLDDIIKLEQQLHDRYNSIK